VTAALRRPIRLALLTHFHGNRVIMRGQLPPIMHRRTLHLQGHKADAT
jgi:hypothetical protein